MSRHHGFRQEVAKPTARSAQSISGIVNDSNDYANETVGDPRYPFDLLRRVITVSLESMKIVRALPPPEI